jgi:hypothetical protein
VAIQTVLPPQQNAIGMALVVFAQVFGGALFLAFAETAFSNSLVAALHKYAPTVDPTTVVQAGASNISHVIPAGELAGVIEAYDIAINHAFYLVTGAAGATLLFCWGMGWHRVNKKISKAEE